MRYVVFLLGALGLVGAFVWGAGFVPVGEGASQKATVFYVTERDFHISAPKEVSRGDLLLTVANKGPDDHELIVVRAPNARLPLRADGLTVDEESLRPVTEPSLEPGAAGAVRELRLHLPPGHYVFFCNMSGHFLAGMHSTLVVR
jgi:uncharacterized cupredoxin-like copper-binding protein